MDQKNLRIWALFTHGELLLVIRNYQLQMLLEAPNDTNFIEVDKLRKEISQKRSCSHHPT